MGNANELISELVRAANRVEHLADVERKELFSQTVVVVRHMRQSIGVLSEPDDADKIVELLSVVAQMGAMAETPDDVRDALLTAAGMLRELHITVDMGFAG
ncbi:MAG: hypothetical protein ACK4N1_12860 [Pseudorhizobium sp.]